jgi:hypothetical protein
VREDDERQQSQEIAVKGRPFKQSTTTAFPPAVTNSFVAEALARQAASRPARTPPKELPVTPTLPKVAKRHRRRRRGGGGGK